MIYQRVTMEKACNLLIYCTFLNGSFDTFFPVTPRLHEYSGPTGNTDRGDLHIILQLAMGWKDYHFHAFHIYGKDYGTYKPGGMMFEDDPKKVFLSDFHFRIGDRFVYDYDFTAGWLHDIRIEAIEMRGFLPKRPNICSSTLCGLTLAPTRPASRTAQRSD